MQNTLEQIKELASQYQEEIIAHRRHLHMHPELGNEEKETAQYIQTKLAEMGIPFQVGVAHTGVVGLIQGGKGEGKTILIRADIDALPMEEKSGASYQSVNEGVCHSCGHDAHTAALLGAARILSQMKSQLRGNVKLCFQPAEEASVGGASLMVDEGVLENPKVDFAIGMHVDPTGTLGLASIESGPVSAYPDFFSMSFHGKGGHGSFPSRSIDPILPAVSAYNMISLISKKVSPLEPCVVQVCMIQAGSAQAVIPDEASLQGTVRTLHIHNRETVKSQLALIAKNVSEIFNVEYSFNYRGRCAPVMNDTEMTQFVQQSVAGIFDGSYQNEQLKIGGEDFCFFSDKVPSTFMIVGSCDGTDKTRYALHNPHFDLNEEVIIKGASAFAKIAVDYLT